MAEKHITKEQNVSLQGRLVTPLDNPRTFDFAYDTINRAAANSGCLYGCTSGKFAYVHQVLVCEYSGETGGLIALADPGRIGYNEGQATPWIPVEPNSCVNWQPCGCPLGPFMYSGPTSGFGEIYFWNDGAFHGGITLVVQIDPQVLE